MIFIAKNEKGVPSWKLVQEGNKTVTRRIKSLEVGKEFAVQPGRGKFAVCRAKVVSCMLHSDWINSLGKPTGLAVIGIPFLNKEANKEGFDSWYSLVNWFRERNQDIEDMFRIEFELVNCNNKEK